MNGKTPSTDPLTELPEGFEYSREAREGLAKRAATARAHLAKLSPAIQKRIRKLFAEHKIPS